MYCLLNRDIGLRSHLDLDLERTGVAAAAGDGLESQAPCHGVGHDTEGEDLSRVAHCPRPEPYGRDVGLDGKSELYVASDNDGELRRYVWVNGRARRETVHTRAEARSMMTWNIMPAPRALLRGE